MDVLDVLKGGLAKVKEGWTIDYLARDKNDRPVTAENSHAVKWCLEGAFQATAGWGGFQLASEATALCGAQVPEDFEVSPGPYTKDVDNPRYRAIFYNNAQESAEPVVELIEKTIKVKEAELIPA